jgi:hypothetical protein
MFSYMKKLHFFILLLLSSISLTAQIPQNTADNTMPKNNIYANFLGDASIVSINYERIFPISSTAFLTGKVGVGYNEDYHMLPVIDWGNSNYYSNKYITFTHHITANWGKKKFYFELGLGGTIVGGNTNYNYLLYPIIGYRLQPFKSNKVNFRVFSCIPVAPFRYTSIWFSPIGVSVGYSF